jgi:hypothetical protein
MSPPKRPRPPELGGRRARQERQTDDAILANAGQPSQGERGCVKRNQRPADWRDTFAAWLARLPMPIEKMDADMARDWLDELYDTQRGACIAESPPEQRRKPKEPQE